MGRCRVIASRAFAGPTKLALASCVSFGAVAGFATTAGASPHTYGTWMLADPGPGLWGGGSLFGSSSGGPATGTAVIEVPGQIQAFLKAVSWVPDGEGFVCVTAIGSITGGPSGVPASALLPITKGAPQAAYTAFGDPSCSELGPDATPGKATLSG